MKTAVLILNLLVMTIGLNAQQVLPDTVFELSSVEVAATRLNLYSTGLNMISMDSVNLESYQHDNLDKIIALETFASVKSYGQGSLATVSFRGTAATHTGVYWNGIQLNQPNIRQFDLSLAPVAYFNSIDVLKGGASSLFGSGNIGGSIHLQNKSQFGKGNATVLSLTAGSFNKYGVKGSFTSSGKSLFTSTKILFKKSQNNFPFKDINNETTKQENASYKHYGIMQDLAWKIKDNWIFNASVWAQSNEREIPATMVSGNSDASQEDESVKGILSLKQIRIKGYSLLKLAYFHDDLHYLDPDSIESIQIDSRIITDKAIGEYQYSLRIHENISLNTGIQFTSENGNSNNYLDGRVTQNTMGLFLSWSQFIPAIQWTANMNFRQDYIEGYNAPFSPSLGLEGKIWKVLYGKINISRNFRAPSFNELYWKPGGNPDLKAEDSWNEEVSLLVRLERNPQKHKSTFTITAYNSNIDNWIAWIPKGPLSYPENIREVHSRGFEISGKTTVKLSKVQFKISEGYTYAASTNEKQINVYDNSYKKQLIYIPLHRIYISGSLSFKGYSFAYNHNFTGIRYTTSDNKNELPAYNTGNLSIGKRLHLKKQKLNFQFAIDNLWNTDYQVIENYPMPGRNYNLSINFYLN
jgi:iron complex outermembrane receptor protein